MAMSCPVSADAVVAGDSVSGIGWLFAWKSPHQAAGALVFDQAAVVALSSLMRHFGNEMSETTPVIT
jgi:hypothetical protein